MHELAHDITNMIKELENRLLEQNIGIKVTDSAKNYLIEKGWDSRYGARPLRRVIQNEVEDKLSVMVIGKEIVSHSTAIVDYEDSKLIIYKE